MSSAITTCEQCGCEFEWNTAASAMPDCPKCGHNPQRIYAESETASLVELLQSGDRYARSGAAAELGKRGDRAAVPALIVALRDSSANTAAAIALGKLRDERAVEPLVGVIQSESGPRSDAVAALFAIGTLTALDAAFANIDLVNAHHVVETLSARGDLSPECLIRMLDCAKADLLQAAAWAFRWRVKDVRAIPYLIPLLKARNYATSHDAAHALSSMNWQPDDLEQQIELFVMTENWEKLKKMGRPAIDGLLDLLRRGGDVEQAAKALAMTGWLSGAEQHGTEAIPPLVAMLKSGDGALRYQAIQTLGKLKSPLCVPALTSAMNDKVAQNAWSAVEKLAELGEPAVEPLCRLLRIKYYWIRDLITILEKIRDQRAVAPLTAIAEHGVAPESMPKHLRLRPNDRCLCGTGKKFKNCCELSIRNRCADAVKELTGTRPRVKTGCFIATATLGNANHPSVRALQQFRDECLERHCWGRAFVTVYYCCAPPFARVLERSPWLKSVSRRFLVQPAAALAIWLLKQRC